MMYDMLSYYYDDLLGDDESLKLWMNELENEIKGKDILELACGSGELALMLAEKGFNVLATDLSETMIDVADKKEKTGKVDFAVMDMTSFRLENRYDAIICFCDSFNYLNDYDEVKAMFENVYQHLNTGGIFMFDTHHPERLNEFEDEYIEEGYLGDLGYSWTILSDKNKNILMEHFAFYTKDGLIEEHHVQNVFCLDKLKVLMEETGFHTKINKEFIENEKSLIIGRRV